MYIQYLLGTLMQKGFRTRSDLLALSSIRQLAQGMMMMIMFEYDM